MKDTYLRGCWHWLYETCVLQCNSKVWQLTSKRLYIFCTILQYMMNYVSKCFDHTTRAGLAILICVFQVRFLLQWFDINQDYVYVIGIEDYRFESRGQPFLDSALWDLTPLFAENLKILKWSAHLLFFDVPLIFWSN